MVYSEQLLIRFYRGTAMLLLFALYLAAAPTVVQPWRYSLPPKPVSQPVVSEPRPRESFDDQPYVPKAGSWKGIWVGEDAHVNGSFRNSNRHHFHYGGVGSRGPGLRRHRRSMPFGLRFRKTY